MTTVSTSLSPFVTLVEGSTPASPSAGQKRLFVASSNHHISTVDSAAAVVDLQSAVGYAPAFVSKAANYTLTGTDTGILGDATGGNITLTLPTAVGASALYYLMKKDSSANTVTIATTSAQTINGASTVVLSAQYAAILVLSDGANWRTVGTEPVGGGTSGGTTLLAAVAGTDGATAACSGSYVALSTAWITGSLVTSAAQDIIIEVEACWLNSVDVGTHWAIFRSGTQIYNTTYSYNGQNSSTVTQSRSFQWVDKAVAAGTYTYEVRPGTVGATTVTLKNATDGGVPTNSSKGGSMLYVSSAANV